RPTAAPAARSPPATPAPAAPTGWPPAPASPAAAAAPRSARPTSQATTANGSPTGAPPASRGRDWVGVRPPSPAADPGHPREDHASLLQEPYLRLRRRARRGPVLGGRPRLRRRRGLHLRARLCRGPLLGRP